MKKKLCLYGILFAMSISGCTQAGNDSADVENETMIVNGVDEEKEESEPPVTEEMILQGSDETTEATDLSDSNQTENTSKIDLAIMNGVQNIYTGYIDDTEIRMKISRQDQYLSAAFITRADEEWNFEGELRNTGEFELRNANGEFMRGMIEQENKYLPLIGTGEISGKPIEFFLRMETYIPIGDDFDNYYSGGGLGGWPEDIEAFAKKIKSSVNNKEEFLKLFHYPTVIHINGESIAVQNEEEMGIQYDKLIAEDSFREKIEHMFTKYLFKNYMGVCVEYGIIWFDGNEIQTINFRNSTD